ncbi:MAG: DUF2339 domain-containing protein [Neisseria sp.]|nr:DUF2339 domain-containing protein [Neisseria sp.]
MHYLALIVPIIMGYLNNDFWPGLTMGIILCLICRKYLPSEERGGEKADTANMRQEMENILREIKELKYRVRNLENGVPSHSDNPRATPGQEEAAPPPLAPQEWREAETRLPATPPPGQGAPAPRPSAYPRAAQDEPEQPPGRPNPLFAWFLRGNPLLKAGVFILFLGLAFLLRYASAHIDIPIRMRYLGVAASGMAAALAGYRLQSIRREYGLVLQGFGIAVIYLTTLAALKLHPLISTAAAFGIMVGMVVVMAAAAVRQNALPLAQIAMVGGMAAPLLVSDGGGNHIVLFSYLALLNAGVAAIAWFKAWRSLNIIGFAGTFLISASWGRGGYTLRHFATAEPFLIYHWLLYTLIACFFARNKLREGEGLPPPPADNATLAQIWRDILAFGLRIHLLDHVLLFGTAGAAFGLQCRMTSGWPHGAAWSALGFAAAYALAAAILPKKTQAAVIRQAFAGLALLFATLAVPLWFEAAETAQIWTLEAAAAYTFGLRRKLPLTRLAALAVYLAAALIQLASYRHGDWTLLGGSVSGTLLTAGGGLYAYFIWQKYRPNPTLWESRLQTASLSAAAISLCLFPALLVKTGIAVITAYSALAALFAAAQYRHRQTVFAVFSLLSGLGGSILAATLGAPVPGSLKYWLGILCLSSSAALFAAAFMLQKTPWQNTAPAGTQPGRAAGWLLMAAGLFWACLGWHDIFHRLNIPSAPYTFLLSSALAVLPPALAARRLDWRQMQNGAHTAILAANAYFLAACILYRLPAPTWQALAFLAADTAAYLYILNKSGRQSAADTAARAAGLLIFAALWTLLSGKLGGQYLDGAWARLAWLAAPAALWLALSATPPLPPFAQHPRVYRLFGGAACALFAACWLLAANIAAPSAPRPYLPLLNPVELPAAALIYQSTRWLQQNRIRPRIKHLTGILILISAFITISAGVMRIYYFYGGIGWNMAAMMKSLGLQATLSITWAAISIILMARAHMTGKRATWFAGISLMGITVVKMFIAELGDSGSIARIVSFIAVGLLLLLVGWFAPLPPQGRETPESQDGK